MANSVTYIGSHIAVLFTSQIYIHYLRFSPIECVLEYKINEAAADFLHMRGIMKKADLEKYKDDVMTIQKLEVPPSPEKHKHIRRSRSSESNDKPCCCAPAKHMVPTFITDNKFNDILETFSKYDN